MVPWLLLAALIGRSGCGLAERVEDRMRRFPCSGEINFTVDDAPAAIDAVLARGVNLEIAPRLADSGHG